MRRNMLLFLAAIAVLACARVNVATEEPIKVDISMRVDVYQHVVKEVDSIEDQIFGDEEVNLNSIFSIASAYAADYSESVSGAITRRKDRAATIEKYFDKGYIGEDKNAYLAVRNTVPSSMTKDIERLVTEENKDRAVIYQATADKNEVSIDQIQKVFFKDHYKRASSGWWFEVERDGRFVWIQK